MTIQGTGPSAPAVVAGESAEAIVSGSPSIPTSIPVPTPTMGARAEDLQVIAEATVDGFSLVLPLAGGTMTGDVTAKSIVIPAGETVQCQTTAAVTFNGAALTADGTGVTITGQVTVTGATTFSQSPMLGTGLTPTNITGATNATPIVITATAHGLVDGQQVTIASVGGNTAANGTWVVDVLSSSTFALVGSAGSGSYTAATGTVQALADVKYSAARSVTRFLANLWNDGNQFTGSGWGFEVSSGSFVNFITDPTANAQHFGYE